MFCGEIDKGCILECILEFIYRISQRTVSIARQVEGTKINKNVLYYFAIVAMVIELLNSKDVRRHGTYTNRRSCLYVNNRKIRKTSDVTVSATCGIEAIFRSGVKKYRE